MSKYFQQFLLCLSIALFGFAVIAAPSSVKADPPEENDPCPCGVQPDEETEPVEYAAWVECAQEYNGCYTPPYLAGGVCDTGCGAIVPVAGICNAAAACNGIQKNCNLTSCKSGGTPLNPICNCSAKP